MADVLNCKHCGGAIAVTGYCTRCGLKIDYVNKALNSSKYYYNIGLDKARSGICQVRRRRSSCL